MNLVGDLVGVGVEVSLIGDVVGVVEVSLIGDVVGVVEVSLIGDVVSVGVAVVVFVVDSSGLVVVVSLVGEVEETKIPNSRGDTPSITDHSPP